MKTITLKVRDKFINTKGNNTTVVAIFSSGSRCTLLSETGTTWHEYTSEVVNRIKKKVYTKYEPYSNQYNNPYNNPYNVGDLVKFKDDNNIFSCSNDFIGEVIEITSKIEIKLKVKQGSFKVRTQSESYNNKRIKGYITNHLSNNNITLINNLLNNEKTREITTDRQSKGSKAIRKQISPRAIAIASTLIGNPITIGNRRRQIRNFEISKVSISTRYY